MNKIGIIVTTIIASCSILHAQNKIATDSLDDFINSAIENKFFPGAQLIIGNGAGVMYSKSYGYTDYSKQKAVDSTTIYDLASCSKICSSTLSAMTLVDSGKLSLDSRLDEYVELADTLEFGDVTVRELLQHTSGFLPGVSVAASLLKTTDEEIDLVSRKKSATNPYLFDTNYYAAKDVIYDSTYISRTGGANKIKITDNLYIDKSYHAKLDSMVYTSYRPEQRGRHRYSDLSFYLLQKIIEKVTAMPLDLYAQQVFDKMELRNIGYKPLEWYNADNIAPTEYDVLFRRDTMRGIVHDEMACVMGGVCGNAGLFSSADNVAKISGMFLRNGVDYNGNRIVNSSTVQDWSKIIHGKKGSVYSIGFIKVKSEKLPYTPQSYGHTGYTGTYFWIDPTKDLYVVLLTNRVHTTRSNKKFDGQYRGELWKKAVKLYGKKSPFTKY